MSFFFRKKIKQKTGLSLKPRRYFLRDLIIVVGVILVWRGVWQLADRFLFPGQPILSETLSIIIGLFLLYLPDRDLSHLTGDIHHYYHHHEEDTAAHLSEHTKVAEHGDNPEINQKE